MVEMCRTPGECVALLHHGSGTFLCTRTAGPRCSRSLVGSLLCGREADTIDQTLALVGATFDQFIRGTSAYITDIFLLK